MKGARAPHRVLLSITVIRRVRHPARLARQVQFRLIQRGQLRKRRRRGLFPEEVDRMEDGSDVATATRQPPSSGLITRIAILIWTLFTTHQLHDRLHQVSSHAQLSHHAHSYPTMDVHHNSSAALPPSSGLITRTAILI